MKEFGHEWKAANIDWNNDEEFHIWKKKARTKQKKKKNKRRGEERGGREDQVRATRLKKIPSSSD